MGRIGALTAGDPGRERRRRDSETGCRDAPPSAHDPVKTVPTAEGRTHRNQVGNRAGPGDVAGGAADMGPRVAALTVAAHASTVEPVLRIPGHHDHRLQSSVGESVFRCQTAGLAPPQEKSAEFCG